MPAAPGSIGAWTTPGGKPSATLRRLVNGYQMSQALHVAATLGVAYVLRAVLQGWDDDEAGAILRSVRRAAASGATLVVIERDLGAPNEAPETKFSDLNMLVIPGGRERTIDEYGALLAAAGFLLVESRPAGFGLHVMVAAPV